MIITISLRVWWKMCKKICCHCATFTKPNQSSVPHNTNQTFSTHETKYQTILGNGGKNHKLFGNCLVFRYLSKLPAAEEEKDGHEREEREEGGVQLQQEIQVSVKGYFVGDPFPSQGTTVEYQDEAGEPSVRVRVLLKLPPHLRGQRHGEGQPEREGLPHCWQVPMSFQLVVLLIQNDKEVC